MGCKVVRSRKACRCRSVRGSVVGVVVVTEEVIVGIVAKIEEVGKVVKRRVMRSGKCVQKASIRVL